MTTEEALRQECCRNCLFMRARPWPYQTGGGDPIMEPFCQRNAPLPAHVITRELPRLDIPWAIWPRVSYQDWCGEFKRRVQLEDQITDHHET